MAEILDIYVLAVKLVAETVGNDTVHVLHSTGKESKGVSLQFGKIDYDIRFKDGGR